MVKMKFLNEEDKIINRLSKNISLVTYSVITLHKHLHMISRRKRQSVNEECPEGFQKTRSGSCWHAPTQRMTYDEAVTYCKNKTDGPGEIMSFLDADEITELYEQLKYGIEPPGGGSTGNKLFVD